MAEVASAYVSILPSAKGFGSKLEGQVGGEVNAAGSGIGKKFGTALKVGAVAAVGGALLAGKFLKGALDEAREAQKVTAQTEAVIKSTGSAAGVTAQQVGDLAGALSLKTGIDDEVIQSGQNMLLTFKNIRNEAGKGNDIFDQSTKALVDMSAAMGSEPKQAAIQLGKALNDPVKGISALSRVGIQFTEDQQKVIKSLVEGGKTAEAQKVILKELNSQFGGSAEAQATAADKFSVAWGNFKETIGTALLPVVDSVLGRLTDLTLFLTDNVGPAFSKVQAFVAPVASAFQSAFGSGGGGGGIAATIQGQILPALQAAGQYLATQLLPSVMGVVNAFKYQFQTIAPIVQAAIAGLVARLAPHWDEIKAALQQVVSTFKSTLDLIATAVRTGTAVVSAVWAKFGDQFLDYLAKTLTNVITVVRGALNIVQGVIRLVTSLIKGDWSGAWDAIKQILRGAWQVISGIVQQGIHMLKSMLSNLGAVLKVLVSKAWDLVVAAFKAGINASIRLVASMPDRTKNALGNVGSMLYNAGKDLIQGFLNGIESMASAVAQKAKDIANGAVGAVKGALGIKSPSKVFHQIGDWTMQGLVNGLAAGEKDVIDAVTGLSTELEAKFLDRLLSMRDGARSILDGLKSDFASLRDSVASAFAPDVFSAPDRFAFMGRLGDAFGNLTALRGALRKLRSWKVDPGFLSQLFASGNSALILDLASGTRAEARSSAQMFGAVGSLSQQLGASVARNEIGPKIDQTNRELAELRRAIDRLPKNFGKEINGAATAGHRGRTP